MTIIEYDDNKYHIIKEEQFSSYKGAYRIIQYDTGVYGLQRFKEDKNSWVTVVVSPVIDDITQYNDYVEYGIYYGLTNIEDIYRSIREADRSFNGDYWEFQLYLSEFGEENFTEIITHGDGETLLEQVRELLELEREQRLWYLENYPRLQIIYSVMFFIILVIVIGVIAKYIGVI